MKKGTSAQQKKPHPQDLCEKCLQLGKSCVTFVEDQSHEKNRPENKQVKPQKVEVQTIKPMISMPQKCGVTVDGDKPARKRCPGKKKVKSQKDKIQTNKHLIEIPIFGVWVLSKSPF